METTNKVIEVLNCLFEKFGIAVDWTASTISEYLPTIINKFVVWKSSTYIFWICFGILWLIGAYLSYRPFRKYVKETHAKGYGIDFDDAETFWLIPIVICSMVGLAVILSNVYDLVHLLAFPEFEFYNYVVKLLK